MMHMNMKKKKNMEEDKRNKEIIKKNSKNNSNKIIPKSKNKAEYNFDLYSNNDIEKNKFKYIKINNLNKYFKY